MSEASSVRDLIARALYEHHAAGFGGGNVHIWDEIVEGGENRPYPEYPHLVDEFRARADAVLAVLADLPADVIEQAARAHKPDLWADDWATASPFVFQTHSESWDAALARARAGQQRDIRAVLAAVFGGEQA